MSEETLTTQIHLNAIFDCNHEIDAIIQRAKLRCSVGMIIGSVIIGW